MGEPPFTYRDDRTIADASGTPLARCYADRGEEEHGPLFAAAPDLLTELKALVTAVCFTDPPKDFNGVECHEARVPTEFIKGARAAIAKAKGQQP